MTCRAREVLQVTGGGDRLHSKGAMPTALRVPGRPTGKGSARVAVTVALAGAGSEYLGISKCQRVISSAKRYLT